MSRHFQTTMYVNSPPLPLPTKNKHNSMYKVVQNNIMNSHVCEKIVRHRKIEPENEFRNSRPLFTNKAEYYREITSWG